MPTGEDGDQKDYDREWLYIAISTVPALLLSLKIWYLSGQSVETTQLVVQSISPISLLVELFFVSLWMLSTVVILFHCAGRLLQLSRADGHKFRLVRTVSRIPMWALMASFAVALFTWHIQYLPALLMLATMSISLHVRLEFPDRPRLVAVICWLFPLATTAAFYCLMLPTALTAWHDGDRFLAAILTIPPTLGLFLGNRLPSAAAPVLVNSMLVCSLAILAPLACLKFLNASFLPAVAVEITQPAQVHTGYVISMSDVATAVLGLDGTVRFFPNNQVKSQVLCRDYTRAPYSKLDINGWGVEETILEAFNSKDHHPDSDQRCFGRPLTPTVPEG
ncbi:hypothetical protein ETD86_31920 [Nonomuraea turkmeniaca]|uniref:Uncharacterized protein n=1 Tax=Nonomuraea turkmeniaca TaxID=103838 RepID=A0A5S4F8F4_9ACTN|nr:hypothetical protein [Nonomuraea turkmeniaca]TMR12727.1 hypothetical protein ETD86_31920 [Nonomuraea turkmeniaca]